MKQQTTDKEIALIKKIASPFLRHPLQVNGLLEADAEIIDFRNINADHLVVKTDGIHEEIRKGLYQDPYLIGWMAVTVTVSDLAATGADPFGILLSLQLKQDYSQQWMERFQQGVNEACTAYHVSILGGDTNFDKQFSVTTCGIATINGTNPLLRKPMLPGDLLYATGKLGSGAALAYTCFLDTALVSNYKPFACLKESKLVREWATACIDTSDGLFPALSVLSDINHAGMRITTPLQELLCDETVNIYKSSPVPAWMFMAGPHGEYQLLFTIRASVQNDFETACSHAGWKPQLLGEITESEKIEFVTEETTVQCEPASIANMYGEAGGNVQIYFEMLMEKHRQWITTKTFTVC